MNPIPVQLIADIIGFAIAWVIGLPAGLIHPMAKFQTYLGALTLACAVLCALAFVAAVLGVGAVSWTLWTLTVGFCLALDVNAVRQQIRYHRAVKRFAREALR